MHRDGSEDGSAGGNEDERHGSDADQGGGEDIDPARCKSLVFVSSRG